MPLNVRAVFFIVALASARFAAAATIVDQSHWPEIDRFSVATANVGASNAIDWAQTFTVGQSGHLVGVDVLVARNRSVTLPLLFDIRTLDGALPSSADAGPNVIISGAISASVVPILTDAINPDVNDFGSVHLSFDGVAVFPGQQLALALRSDNEGEPYAFTYVWGLSETPLYAGGGHYARWESDAWSERLLSATGYDMAFKTYIRTIPEPSSVGACLLGFAIIATCRRLRMSFRC
ncbi:hypothetical protein [Lacipirellula sp.]|uniref:hypothetical protein n=1 Tax=Lacipirellula sp. TaxID=2691419 RepID=UPI003D0AC3A6